MASDHAKTTEAAEATCKRDDFELVREFMTKVGDKWSIVLLVALERTSTKRARFSELQRKLAPISQRVLTATLRNLERDGFVSREVFAEVPPRVEYELTSRGIDLLEPLELLVQWITMNWPAIKQSRKLFDDHAR
jgi:DNA-binding HxlR family transcriptional regulator